MKAYAILDGGGVKGAALAGCLKAANERGVQFVGYGGTSAGAIVALLASVGYSPEDLHDIMVDEINFTDFLDDGGLDLRRLKEIPRALAASRMKLPVFALKYRNLLLRLHEDLGLYQAKELKVFLLAKIKKKLRDLTNKTDVTFEDLRSRGCPPLKIVASDLALREPCVYSGSGGAELNGSVIDAVQASMSYPFVFRPVKMNDRYLVDGGLSSNLPIFLFEDERRKSRLPLIAFDLVSSKTAEADSEYGLGQFCGDMLATALESGDYLMRKLLGGVYHVPIQVPSGIDTLDFSISTSRREELFNAGHSAVHSFFSKAVPQWEQAKDQIEGLQALHAPPELVEPVLRAVARDVESGTPATNVRTNITLPTEHGTRIVTYQFGMDNDPDIDLELDIEGGCSGFAASNRKPTFADLVDAKESYEEWRMTRAQQNKVKPDRKAMLSVPMFSFWKDCASAPNIDEMDVVGVLSIDTDISLTDTSWLSTSQDYVLSTAKRWADIASRIIE
jgi:NTE family protein